MVDPQPGDVVAVKCTLNSALRADWPAKAGPFAPWTSRELREAYEELYEVTASHWSHDSPGSSEECPTCKARARVRAAMEKE